jgi:hypothetical protein
VLYDGEEQGAWEAATAHTGPNWEGPAAETAGMTFRQEWREWREWRYRGHWLSQLVNLIMPDVHVPCQLYLAVVIQ